MRWLRALLIGTALLASLPGCRTCAPVERALRARETDLRETKEELERQQAINRGLQLELEALHTPPTVPGVVTSNQGGVYPVRSLVLGRQTGGIEDGSGCGDQGLQVIVQPMDADNSSIKVPGSLIVQVLEVSSEGLKRPLSTWDIPPDQLSRTWRNGLLSTGYALSLPWKMWPTSDKLRVIAQLRTNDGRVFEADRDVTVRLPPLSQRRMPPPEPVIVPNREETLPKEQQLPLPRETDGPKLETSAKAQFTAVLREPILIPNWNDPWRPAPATVRMQRPIATP